MSTSSGTCISRRSVVTESCYDLLHGFCSRCTRSVRSLCSVKSATQSYSFLTSWKSPLVDSPHRLKKLCAFPNPGYFQDSLHDRTSQRRPWVCSGKHISSPTVNQAQRVFLLMRVIWRSLRSSYTARGDVQVQHRTCHRDRGSRIT